MNKAEQAILTTIIITLFGTSASLLLPLPAGNNPFEFYFNLIISLATMLLYIGGAVVIIMGFSTLTDKFRRAYTILFMGLTFWALAYLQLPIIVATGWINNNFVISLTVIPFILSALLTFIGTRRLTKLFEVKTIATKWWFVTGVVSAICILTAFAPHVTKTINEFEFDSANILIMIAITLFGFGAYHILHIKSRASLAFTNAFAWLFLSMTVLSVFAGAGSTLATLVVAQDGGQIVLYVALVPSCIAAALFLRSAYSFNQIAAYEDIQGQFVARDFFGHPIHPKKPSEVSSIDIVTHAATLVSTRESIANIMDNVRYITSQLPLNPPLPLPATTESALKQIYLQIEQYLLTKETIRKFTKETLRHDIAQKLGLEPTSTLTFWNTLT